MAAAMIRSAKLLKAASPWAWEGSVSMPPPSTIMPSGAPCEASQGGKRDSNGYINRLANGVNPIASIRIATI